MRFRFAALAAWTLLVTVASPAPAQDRLHFSVNVGQQVTERPFKQTLTFQQYLEQADLTLERTIPKQVFFDGGGAVRLIARLYAGVAFSAFTANGTGAVTAHVPNPLFFGQLRTTKGDVAGVNRKETAAHFQVGWTIPTAGGLEFTPFAGPTIFQAEQVFVKQLNLTLAGEVYPYDPLTFPGVTTETIKDRVNGYNAGVDMTWRFSKTLGVGALIRSTHGTKNQTPTGGQATKVEVGGLHAGVGVRVIF